MNLFEGNNMTAGYGGADIIKHCNLNVRQSEIVVVLLQEDLCQLNLL